MRIVMMTNTYLPHTGGVANSVAAFRDAFRSRGHRVLVVAPTFEGMDEDETDVIRVPALQNFNGSDFSVRLPAPGGLRAEIESFQPDLVHAHHPFLLGDTALRVAAYHQVPVVFTHHTMYERYTHYVPGDSPVLRRFVVRLGTEFANLCDHVIAPSESIAEVLRSRGVTTPITAVPTGIDPKLFREGSGGECRRERGIPDDAFVVGHVGRLAEEKNLSFLAQCVGEFLVRNPEAHFLLVGSGDASAAIEGVLREHGVAERLHATGTLRGGALADAYHAMDVFAFASHSETQGMVLAEAMTAGVPVVAVDAAGVREVVVDEKNGRLLAEDDVEAFADALAWCLERDRGGRDALRRAALETAESFSLSRCADRLFEVYERVVQEDRREERPDDSTWSAIGRWIEEEWAMLSGKTQAAGDAIAPSRRRDDA